MRRDSLVVGAPYVQLTRSLGPSEVFAWYEIGLSGQQLSGDVFQRLDDLSGSGLHLTADAGSVMYDAAGFPSAGTDDDSRIYLTSAARLLNDAIALSDGQWLTLWAVLHQGAGNITRAWVLADEPADTARVGFGGNAGFIRFYHGDGSTSNYATAEAWVAAELDFTSGGLIRKLGGVVQSAVGSAGACAMPIGAVAFGSGNSDNQEGKLFIAGRNLSEAEKATIRAGIAARTGLPV